MADTDTLPLYPTTSPEVFRDPGATVALFAPVFDRLASLVEVDAALLDAPTPCRGFTVAALQRHVLAWLQFFAAALQDPDATAPRLDPEAWELGQGDRPAAIVTRAAEGIARAVTGGVAGRLVVMSQARMAGDGVLAMALGEYLVHGWDLARATGREYDADDDAGEAALTFLQGMVAPEHRGPDSGFFDAEVPAAPGATAFERLLCFAGRHPDWAPEQG
ncbi:MAG: TIGR03086 family metal-binding protein [Acidimicrobiales bacterium]